MGWDNTLRRDFAAYYIDKVIYPTEAEHGHEDWLHQNPVKGLRYLFSTNSMCVLPIISFIDAAIIGHAKAELLEQFYDDCWKCARSTHCFEARVIEPFLQAGRLLSQRNRHIGYTNAADREEQESFVNSDIMRTTDLESRFRQSRDMLEQRGFRKTPTYVIMRLYHAWAVKEMGHYQQCLDMLLSEDGLPLAEQVLGLGHLQTTKCYKVKVQCYARVGNALAKDDLAIAIHRLSDYAYPIQPYKHRLLLDLATAQLERGDTPPQDIQKALQIQRDVIEYMWKYFGPFQRNIWFAVEQHIKALRAHRGSAEADTYEQYLHACHDRAWRQASPGSRPPPSPLST